MQMASSTNLGATARAALEALFSASGRTTVQDLFHETLIQHDPNKADGLQGLMHFAEELARSPHARVTVLRTLVDRDFVVLHSIYDGLPGATPSMIAFDIFRFQHGKIVEHWGGQEPLMGLNVSGRSQTDGANAVADRDKTEYNRQRVRDFKQAVTVELQFDRIDEFIDGHNYAQHASKVGDGTDRLKARIAEATRTGSVRNGPVLHPKMYLAEGNFVLALVDAQTDAGHTANYDLFRVEGGKLVEHWDVLSEIPPQEDRKNTNSPF